MKTAREPLSEETGVCRCKGMAGVAIGRVSKRGAF
jgi:hypothetical protein